MNKIFLYILIFLLSSTAVAEQIEVQADPVFAGYKVSSILINFENIEQVLPDECVILKTQIAVTFEPSYEFLMRAIKQNKKVNLLLEYGSYIADPDYPPFFYCHIASFN